MPHSHYLIALAIERFGFSDSHCRATIRGQPADLFWPRRIVFKSVTYQQSQGPQMAANFASLNQPW